MVVPSLVVAAWLIGAGLSAIRAAATRQCLDPLDIFARLLPGCSSTWEAISVLPQWSRIFKIVASIFLVCFNTRKHGLKGGRCKYQDSGSGGRPGH